MRDDRLVVFSMLRIAIICAMVSRPAAQPGPAQTGAALSGTWIVNRDLSQASPSFGDAGGAGRGRGRDGGVPGGGARGGGRSGFGGRGSFDGGPSSDFGGDRLDPEQMNKTRALMEELMTATPRLSIFQRDEGRIVFVDADAHTRTFTTSGKKEKHQLQAGTIETATKWDGTTLVQQSELGGGVKVTQTFAIDEAKRLVISTALDGTPMGKMPPSRRVYDPEGPR